MSKETTRQKSPAGAKRKLTRAEKKEIAAIIQRAKGDGKPPYGTADNPLCADVPGRNLQGIGKEIQQKHCV